MGSVRARSWGVLTVTAVSRCCVYVMCVQLLRSGDAVIVWWRRDWWHQGPIYFVHICTFIVHIDPVWGLLYFYPIDRKGKAQRSEVIGLNCTLLLKKWQLVLNGGDYISEFLICTVMELRLVIKQCEVVRNWNIWMWSWGDCSGDMSLKDRWSS